VTRSRWSAADDGSAVVELVLVLPLLLVLFLGVLQVGFAVHVRNTLATSAAEGARHGAAAGRTDADAARRTREVAGSALAASLIGDVTVEGGSVDGAPVVVVRVRGRLPMLGVWGPAGRIDVRARALRDGSWS
jgi:Flp pilus assembly protein TadG